MCKPLSTQGGFAVNLLSSCQEDLSKRFSMALADKWDGIEYAATASGCPYFTGALVVFDCCIRDRYNGGDHIIVVGEVLSFSRNLGGEPLLFYRGAYRSMS
ncbi:MAG: flavin reductase family protein [Candidatus Porifericomitaceae bacterium WSBS_2022_MAG_OTU9]